MGIIKGGAEEIAIEIYTNTDFGLTLIMFSDDANTVLVDNTGYTGKMLIQPKNSNKVLVELSDANGRMVFGGANGTVALSINKATLASIPEVSDAEYDLLITDTTPLTKKYLYGQVVFEKGQSVI